MAVSYRIVIFLIALLISLALVGALQMPVGLMEGPVVDNANTEETQQLYEWTGQIWGITPVIIMLAGGAWLLKQGVIVGQ